ncbi:hypothetical protein DPMN_072862 [Dreissena polymorpha]|uniref:Uncharacterized protein n=1 Tax=Dreissena polymorpha TaxID=45954 RepID=A0A9D4BY36_DREPO|nr:hypothetical protein DPMN_072862 [Dreissena polymorpha]
MPKYVTKERYYSAMSQRECLNTLRRHDITVCFHIGNARTRYESTILQCYVTEGMLEHITKAQYFSAMSQREC